MRKIGGLLFMLCSYFAQAQIVIQVVDEQHQNVIGAVVTIMPDSLINITNANGIVRYEQVSKGLKTLKVQFMGYESPVLQLDYTGDSLYREMTLQEKPALLDKVTIHGDKAKQDATLAMEYVNQSFLEAQQQDNLSATLDKLAGVSSITTGTGIGKPVIRGLSANRVLVTSNGIKQEGQQWGNDHGLEVDPYRVERLELVKGPASLQYGSDAMGGVINILPSAPPQHNSIAANWKNTYKTNNQQWASSLKVGANRKDWFITGRYTYLRSGDYQVPASQFTYNGYVLPIENNRLKNTATKENHFSLHAGHSNQHHIIRLSYQRYQQQMGLFTGAIGIPRSYSLQHDDNYRDIDVPHQKVTHQKWSLEQTYFFKKSHLNINLGIQENDREERTFPEFHSTPDVDPGNTLALGLLLRTYTANAHLDQHLLDNLSLVVGGDAQYQENNIAGFDFLLPPFNTLRSGIYAITEFTPGKPDSAQQQNTLWQAGLRVDYGENHNAAAGRGVYSSGGNLLDSLRVNAQDQSFFNWSGSIGFRHKWTEKDLLFRGHLGKSFRLPYLNETASNGMHHGTFRHEVGTPGLQPEQGYQLDASLAYFSDKWQAELATYANYFANYIYLTPTARFSRLPEAGQLFEYAQHNAFYTGFEAEFTTQLHPMLALLHQWEYVWNINLETGLPLPFTPPASAYSQLNFQPANHYIFHDSRLWLSHEWAFAQNRVNRNELATPGYHVIGIGLRTSIHIQKQVFQIGIRVDNLLNTPYLKHLSRYRLLGLPEQGRNISLTLSIPLQKSLKTTPK